MRDDLGRAIQDSQDPRAAYRQEVEDMRAQTEKMIAASFDAMSRSQRMMEMCAGILGVPVWD
jgi:hypothetical protein